MENLLKYQKLDIELGQLEKQILTSETQDMLNKLSAMYKEIQKKLMEHESNAKALWDEYNQTNKLYKKTVKQSIDLSTVKIDKLSAEQLGENLHKANQLSSELFMLERKLNQIITNINTSLKEFEVIKNRAHQTKNKHAEVKRRLEQETTAIQPKIEDIKKQLKKIEPTVNKELLTKYKSLKNDNVLPAFVSLKDDRCGYCRVEIPRFKLDKLKTEPYIICEQCHRFIYK